MPRREKNLVEVGQRVRKISGKPFKSNLQVGTVTGIVPHPYLPGKNAYTFAEDDSKVQVEFCTLDL